GTLSGFFVNYPGLLRWAFPLAKFPPIPYRLVMRYDDVREVLRRDDIFHMGIADKMKRLTGGPNFVLGMDDGPEHRRTRGYLMQAFRHEDVATTIAPLCARMSRRIVYRAQGRLNAVQDLITYVPARVCERYFGVPLDDSNRLSFTHWTFAISQYLFL